MAAVYNPCHSLLIGRSVSMCVLHWCILLWGFYDAESRSQNHTFILGKSMFRRASTLSLMSKLFQGNPESYEESLGSKLASRFLVFFRFLPVVIYLLIRLLLVPFICYVIV